MDYVAEYHRWVCFDARMRGQTSPHEDSGCGYEEEARRTREEIIDPANYSEDLKQRLRESARYEPYTRDDLRGM